LLFFEHLLGKAEQIRSADDVYAAIAEMFDAMADFPGWEFDADAERHGAQQLARRLPDALILSVYDWNVYCTNRGQRPRQFNDAYFQMKRLVSQVLAEVYPVGPPPGDGHTMRVAIWVPWLPNNPNNNIMRVAAGYLGGLLQRDGVEAALVVTNEFSHAIGSSVEHARTDPRPFRPTLESVIGEYNAPPSALHMAPPPFIDEGNLAWFLAFQQSFAPDVIFIPNFEMSSAHIHGFARSAATVYLQTSVRNRPPYDFTRYLYLGEKRKIDDSHIHPDRWHYHTFGYGNFGAGSNLTRADIGLAEDAFVTVTAGNRLENEVNPEIIEIMANVMDTHPHVTWMLMGVKNEPKIRENLGPRFATMQDRVVCKSYVREVGDYLSLCDLYVNPRRTGGAVSMALAVYGQTPVLSFHGNDACNFLVEEMMHDSPDSYGAKLAALVSDTSDLNRVAAQQWDRFEAGHTVAASAADLEAHLRAAQADWGEK